MSQGTVAVPAAVGEPAPSAILFNSTGLGYGVFPVMPALPALLPKLKNPVARAAAYVNGYENMLNGQAFSPAQLLDFVRRNLTREPEELNLKLLTGQASAVFWQFLTPAQRRAVAPALEQELWAALLKNPAPNAKKQLFKTYQSIALTPAAQTRLYQIWQHPTGPRRREADRGRLHRAGPGAGRARLRGPRSPFCPPSWPASKTTTAASACSTSCRRSRPTWPPAMLSSKACAPNRPCQRSLGDGRAELPAPPAAPGHVRKVPARQPRPAGGNSAHRRYFLSLSAGCRPRWAATSQPRPRPRCGPFWRPTPPTTPSCGPSCCKQATICCGPESWCTKAIARPAKRGTHY